MKKILVVGGAGFIGSMVNKFLNKEGYSTVVFDNLTTGNKDSVLYGEFVFGDLKNIIDIERIFERYRFDAVMHFASSINVGESVERPDLYYQNNVCNTLNLLNVMLKYDVKHIIFSSSAAVYGQPKTQLITEDHPLLPINPYGRTKMIIEGILQDYDHAYQLKSSSLRYFNAAGGDPDGEIKVKRAKELNLIPIVLKSLVNNDLVNIYGTDYPTDDGTCIRDYIHIADLAEAHKLALEKVLQDNISTTYNLGNGNGFSVKQVLEAIERVTGLKVNAISSTKRAGDSPYLVANSKKAYLELGWKTKINDLNLIVNDAWKAIGK